jgi:hypothetical protein
MPVTKPCPPDDELLALASDEPGSTGVREVFEKVDRLYHPDRHRPIAFEPPEGTDLIFFCRDGQIAVVDAVNSVPRGVNRFQSLRFQTSTVFLKSRRRHLCISIQMGTGRCSKYQDGPMSVVLTRKPRPSECSSREAVVRLATARHEPLTFDAVWSNTLAVMSLAALVGIIVFLEWNR